MSETRRQFLQTLGGVIGANICLPQTSRSEEQALSKRPPNILFFFPDQHRYDWTGMNKDIPVRTPHLDALARRGVYFANALCPSPLCAPSRACLASGKEYDRCRVPGNHVDYPIDQTTFYQLLRQAGYHVSGCGKFDLHKASPTWGIKGDHLLNEWGFSSGIDNAGKWDAINSGRKTPKDPYMYYLHKHELAKTHVDDFMRRRKVGSYKATFPTPLPEKAYCDNWVAQNGLDLMNQFPKDKPWFIQVNFAGPHDPVDVTKRMHSFYDDVDFPQPNQSTQFTPEKHNAIRRNYSAMVENIDEWLGRYIKEIEKRGELDNTLIVFSSDHGEMLGDHNLWAKTKPHQPSVGVPLVIAGPGIAQNIWCEAPATILDLSATFLDYANVDIPSDMDSQTLRPILSGKEKATREYVYSGLRSWRQVFDGRYKLTTGYGKSKEPLLFDLQEDPKENNNIASTNPTQLKRLEEYLKEI